MKKPASRRASVFLAWEMPMSEMNEEVSRRDRLYAALCLATVGVMGLVALYRADLRSRPFVRYHAVHSIALGFIVILIGLPGITACLTLPAWLALLFLAFRTYNGVTLVVPFLTDLLKNQGWV